MASLDDRMAEDSPEISQDSPKVTQHSHTAPNATTDKIKRATTCDRSLCGQSHFSMFKHLVQNKLIQQSSSNRPADPFSFSLSGLLPSAFKTAMAAPKAQGNVWTSGLQVGGVGSTLVPTWGSSGYLSSKLGGLGVIFAPCWGQTGQDGAKMGPRWTKMEPRWAKIRMDNISLGPRWPNLNLKRAP